MVGEFYTAMTEKSLRESDRIFRLIVENVSDVIGVLDSDCIYQYASPSIEQVLGFPPGRYIGRSTLDFLHPDDISVRQEQFDSMRFTKQVTIAEFRYQHLDGHWVVLEGHTIPVLGENNEIEGFVTVARDFSERRDSEERLRRSETLSIVGKLAAGVAHEIRNPLTAIKGFLQLLARDNSNKQNYMEIMLAELTRIESILGDLLMLAKPHQINFVQKSLEEMIRYVVTLLASEAWLNRIEIITDIVTPGLIVDCDEYQLKQVFINLGKNALDAMPDGGTLTIRVESAENNQVAIRFIDQGLGIPADQLTKLGEAFYTTKENGTGLGLMTSSNIISHHHGQLKIDSLPQQGTTVSVYLPILRN